MSTYSSRPLAATDAPALGALVNAAWQADQIEMVLSPEEAEEFIGGAHFTPSTDGRVITTDDGSMVAYGRALLIPSEFRNIRCFLDGAVHPDHRRRGLGTDLLEWLVDRGSELLAGGPPDLPRYLIAHYYDWQDDTRALFDELGFRPVRYFQEMLRSLDDLPSQPDTTFEIRAWDLSRSEEIRQVKNTAFEDHWGSTPTDAESWDEWMEEHGTRLDLSHIAVADGVVIGHCLNANYPADEAIHGRREGWISNLGTLPGWRGRGVASALITASLHSFVDAGMTHAAIGVDSESQTGAHQLYERLGFRVIRRETSVRREVVPGA